MKELWKKLSSQERVMVVMIILLIIGIATRWQFVKKEAGDAIEARIETMKGDTAPQTSPQTSSEAND